MLLISEGLSIDRHIDETMGTLRGGRYDDFGGAGTRCTAQSDSKHGESQMDANFSATCCRIRLARPPKFFGLCFYF